MRQVWTLPDEEIYRQFTPESLLTIIDGLDVDGAAKVLLLLWRTWQVRNNQTHDTEKYTIDGSVCFLLKYWAELCDIQQKASTFDAKGKRPMSDSLAAGKQGRICKKPSNWQKPDVGWININVDSAFDACFGGRKNQDCSTR